MLLTDHTDYPRGYGNRIGVLYYIVAAPGTRPIFVDGYEESSYRIAHYGVLSDESKLLAHGWVRMDVSAKLQAKALEYYGRRPCY